MARAELLPVDDDAEFVEYDTTEQLTDHERKMQDFAAAMSDLGANSEIIVKRQTGNGKDPMEHVGYFEPDEYTFGQLVEHLRNQYGPGLYRIYLRVNGKNKGNSLVRIAAPVQKPEKQAGIGGEVSAVLGQVMATIQNQNREIVRLLQSDRGGSRKDMLEEMLLYKQLFGNGGGGNGLSQLRESVGLLSELGVNVGGPMGEKDDEGFGGLLEKMTPLITHAMNKPQPALQPNPGQNTEQKMNLKNLFIKQGLNTLLKAASKNADPITYGELVLDQLPEEIVRQFITAHDAFDRVIKMDPRAAQFKPWFLELAEHVKGQLGMPSKYQDLYAGIDDDISDEKGNSVYTDNQVDNVYTPEEVQNTPDAASEPDHNL